MAVRSSQEIMNSLKGIIGENNSDEALSLIEDVADTMRDYETRVGEDWKSKYEENDSMWRNKYKERFFSGNDPDPQLEEQTTGMEESLEIPTAENVSENLTYDGLFTVEEEVK